MGRARGAETYEGKKWKRRKEIRGGDAIETERKE